MNIDKNYYQILDINKNATATEIKQSYRKLAIKYHPDKNKGDKTKEKKFKEISEAYNILNDQNKKESFDILSKFGKSYNSNNIFDNLFNFTNPFENFKVKQEQYREFHENLDINVNVVITLKNVYDGLPIKVFYKRFQHCDDCQGTGFDRKGQSDICEMCNGTGKDNFGRTCNYCQGLGKIFSKTCSTCNGEKIIIKDTEFNLNNINKIRNSKEEYLKGFGHQSKYFREKKGTLKLNIIYQNIMGYTIENDKLFYNLDLHYEDAVKGIKYEYKQLDDNKLNIFIPEKTSDGNIIRLKGKGLYINYKDRDDFYIRINIIIDYNRLF